MLKVNLHQFSGEIHVAHSCLYICGLLLLVKTEAQLCIPFHKKQIEMFSGQASPFSVSCRHANVLDRKYKLLEIIGPLRLQSIFDTKLTTLVH